VLTFPAATNWLTCLGGLDLGNGLLFQPQLTATSLSLVGTAYSTSLTVPKMFILPSFGGVSVNWPGNFPGWTLEATTNLLSPSWLPISACENNALVPNNGSRQFFRLAQ
ncbi:MAG TPA: hypothetical protein VH251_12320, partial [Verrucomicrobiae bacterium]|nr:hypothetical protein [Verrucomicrobiae bacterium]